MRSWLFAALLLIPSARLAAQNIGINANGATPNASAMLDIDVSAIPGTKRGLLIPRVTTVERNAIPTPATSLLVFNTTTARFEYFDGATWVPFVGGGTLDQAYDFGGAGVGRTITADAGAVTIDGTDGLVSTGTTGIGAVAPSGAGIRMVWNPRKNAFRAGAATGTEWDPANIGLGSTAFGTETRASGSQSTALGNSSVASAGRSTAMGNHTTASGLESIAMGDFSIASGDQSTAMGRNTIASGRISTAMGLDNTAPSIGETVLGIGATFYTPTLNGATQWRAANATDRLLVVGNSIDVDNDFIVDGAERSDALVVLKNGNTGIGSSTPADRLHVVGNIRMVDGNQAVGRVMVSNANGTATWVDPLAVATGLAWTLTGNAGTNPATNFVGTTDAQALRFRVNNVFAGNLSNTATGLVSIGLNAGPVNTGLGNTFLGGSAGVVNTTGGSNTFVGQGAGAANTTTFSNTYVGTGAGGSNTTGAQNVYIGRQAGANGTTGSDNILIGNQAGIGNTANNNVMVGSFAGNGNSTGGGNTFLGGSAGSATTTGGQNTFVGTGAGSTNITGTQNTLIGNGAALNANNLTNATAIGRGSRVDVNDGLVLGSVNGINAATSTSLVGIGTTAPLDRLHVVGNIRMVDGNQALGRVLTSDANGTATWQTASAGGTTLDGAYDFGGAGVGRTITADAGAVTIAGTDGLLTTGTLGTGADPQVVGAGTRMFFNPKKAAFRAGQVNGAQWNTANVGNHSVAMGLNTTASGIGAVALGEAVAATALGSAAIGFNNTASGTDSKAIGLDNIASGTSSIALGANVTTSGGRSAGLGSGLLVRSFSEVTLGMNNTDYVPNSTAVFNAADRLLVVGNGAAPATRSDALVILKNGNTGIGSSTPAARLHVVGNIRMVDGNQAAGRVLVSDANGTGTWTDPLTVASGTAWTLTGNAGTNPATNFLGTTDAQPLRLRVGNSFAGQLSNTATGVVSYGLGAGAVNTGNRNTFVGSGAGDANTTGVDNTFLGHDAGGANTTSVEGTFIGSGAGLSNSGVSNTFVGAGSGVSNSTGGGNTFLGRRTGFINSTGNGNTFLGTDAGNANVTGSDGTFVGRGAGQSNTASNNTFVGGRAGDANTTGTSNTFIGRDAGGANLTGSDGTFLGASAGLVNTGSNNTFVGSGAGDANTVGTGNTFIGKDAGGANTSQPGNTFVGDRAGLVSFGLQNTFVGSDAGVANTSGFWNLFLGVNTGSANIGGGQNTFVGTGTGNSNTSGGLNTFVGFGTGSSNTQGTRNVLLGEGSDVTTNNLNNAIAIGSGATVGASNSMVLGDIGANAVNVGIGMTTPLTTLDVLGALTLRDDGTNVVLTVDNQLVTVGNRGHIRLGSDSGTLFARTITLSDGVVNGQLLIIENADAGTDEFDVSDDQVNRNTNTSGSRQMGKGDIITLMWTGTFWNEVSYANN